MSIIKYINGKNWGKQNLKRIVSYITKEEKTNCYLTYANGVDEKCAAEDMLTLQRLVGKDNKRQYIHYVLSFDENVSAELGFRVAKESASYYEDDFPFIMSVHTDTNHIHAHVILSTVNVRTGLKFSQSKGDMIRYREFVNEILDEYNLKKVGNDKNLEFESFEEFESFDEQKWNDSDEEPTQSRKRKIYVPGIYDSTYSVGKYDRDYADVEEGLLIDEAHENMDVQAVEKKKLDLLLEFFDELGISMEFLEAAKEMVIANAVEKGVNNEHEMFFCEEYDDIPEEMSYEKDEQVYHQVIDDDLMESGMTKPIQYGEKDMTCPIQYGKKDMTCPIEYGEPEKKMTKPIVYFDDEAKEDV